MRNLLLLCAGVVACGGSLQNGDDAGTGNDGGTITIDAAPADAIAAKPDAGFPGPHPEIPQVLNYGGSVLSAPNVIPIFFAGDADQSKIEDFLNQIAASSFWSEAVGEYGVGAMTIGKSIIVTDTAPTTTTPTAIENWIATYLDGSHPEFPAVTVNNVYSIFYPSTTTISDPQLGSSCVTFGGYHDNASTTPLSAVIAVMPRCASFGASIQGFDALTAGLSHELVEAATDPRLTDPAYAIVDYDHMVWNLMPLGEVGDMCAYQPQSYQRLVGSYLVQRPWSNASAKAGHDPCVPVLGQAYFNSAPVLTDAVTLDYYGQNLPTKGVQIPLHQSKTIDVQLFADGPTSNWTVQAVDSTYNTSKPPQLQFSWDTQVGNNGDTLHLTITRIANGDYNGTEFFIYSEQGVQIANLWFGFVEN